jgi:hypothetical protein
MAAKVTTAWGSAVVVEEISIPQSAEEKDFASTVQLLEGKGGERFVRFAYSTNGVNRRGPVTLREADVARLHAELAERPELAAALGLPAASSRRGGGLRRRRS